MKESKEERELLKELYEQEAQILKEARFGNVYAREVLNAFVEYSRDNVYNDWKFLILKLAWDKYKKA